MTTINAKIYIHMNLPKFFFSLNNGTPRKNTEEINHNLASKNFKETMGKLLVKTVINIQNKYIKIAFEMM